MHYLLITLYLAAIVVANLLVAQFGPGITILNAFLFIGLDLTTRDKLHDTWQGKHLWLKMLVLITTGSILSAILNYRATPIAIASCGAFLASGVVDALVYTLLAKYPRFARVNGSNLVGAAVDSIVFPALAFGFPLLWAIVLGQFVAKALGGLLWSIILRGKRDNFTANTTQALPLR